MQSQPTGSRWVQTCGRYNLKSQTRSSLDADSGLTENDNVESFNGKLRDYWLSCGIFHALRVVQAPNALHIAPQSEFAAGAIVKQARKLGYRGPVYGETITVGTTALDVAGDAATGLKAITAAPDPNNEKAQEVLANFRARYNYVTSPWHLGSA